MEQAVHLPQAYQSGIKAGIAATRSSFTSSTTISGTCPRTLSCMFISKETVDYSCRAAISWLTSSATTKEAKKDGATESGQTAGPCKIKIFYLNEGIK